MKGRSVFRSPVFWLSLCGVILLACCNLNTSAGFLLFLAGAGLLGLAWIAFLLRRCKREDLPDKSIKIWIAVKNITFTVIVLCFLLFLAVEGMIVAGAKDDPRADARTVIVLGAGIRGDLPSATLTSRLELALRYLRDHPDCAVIVSGGQGRDEQTSEAAVMAAWLREHGVDPNRIYLEDGSHNTRENLVLSQALMEEKGLSGPVNVVSNSFHLFRVRHLARGTRLPPIGTLGAPLPLAWLIPGTYVREFGSVILMYFREAF